MDNEVWKPYPDYPWIEGSSLGRVRTLDRYVRNKNGKRIVKGRILKQHHTNRGYMDVQLTVNGKRVHILVHRLVAQTFIPNPDNFTEVNHKDGNRTKNCVSNLEWCTHEYNMQYKEKYGVSAAEALGRPVYAVNLNTLEVSWFPSQSEASQKLSVNDGNLNSVLKGRYKQTGGYWFTYADENAVEATKQKFGSEVADKVKDLMKDKELQLA